MSNTENDIRRVLLKHPSLPRDYARRMAEDLKRKKTPAVLKPAELTTENTSGCEERIREAKKRHSRMLQTSFLASI